MNNEEIQKDKAEFIDLCHSYIKRKGLEDLLAYLEQSDFYTAPSSTNFHLNEEGGLCLHSMNVFHTALRLNQAVLKPAFDEGNANFSQEIAEESIAICALFHDLCKVKLYHKTEKWKKDEEGRWVTYPSFDIQDDFPFGHGEKSCFIINWYLHLTREELLAIRWHMGMFDMGEQGSSMRFSFRAALEKSPLVALLHAADFLSSNCLEKTTQWK